MFKWQNFEEQWKKYFIDRDHFNEAHLVSDRELAQYRTLDPTILKDAAVKIMTLYLAIFRSGENSGNGVNAMMQEFRDLYCQTEANEGLVRRMMRYVAPAQFGLGNLALVRDV